MLFLVKKIMMILVEKVYNQFIITRVSITEFLRLDRILVFGPNTYIIIMTLLIYIAQFETFTSTLFYYLTLKIRHTTISRNKVINVFV